MPGSATIDPNILVDSLLGVVDDLRSELNTAFGVRAFDVSTVVRVWSGGSVGVGTFTDTEVAITPQPSVKSFSSFSRDQEPCGYDMAGAVKLTEVSLTYTQAELLACEPPQGSEHLIKITEAGGRAQQPKYFVHAKSPYPDPVKTIGWHVWLTLVEDDC